MNRTIEWTKTTGHTSRVVVADGGTMASTHTEVAAGMMGWLVGGIISAVGLAVLHQAQEAERE